MKLKQIFFAAVCVAAWGAQCAQAQSVSDLQISVDAQNNVVLAVQLEGAFLQGNAHVPDNYGQMQVHGIVPSEASGGSGNPGCTTQCTQENEGGTGSPSYHLVSGWGEAEVVLGCYTAAVALSQHVNGQSQVIVETMLNTDYCGE